MVWPTSAVTPVPDSAAVCVLAGSFSALSVNVTVPLSAPLDTGANATAIAHALPAASTVLDVQSVPPDACCVKLPVIARLVTVSCWLPTLLTATVCAPLLAPTFTLPKFSPAACVRFTSYSCALSETYTFPDPSTIIPFGLLIPVTANTDCGPLAGTFTICPFPVSATYTVPAASTATPLAPLYPLPIAVAVPPPAGYSLPPPSLATYTFPAASTPTPRGFESPVAIFCNPPPPLAAVTTLPCVASVTYRFPAPSTATPPAAPTPIRLTVDWSALFSVPFSLGTSSTPPLSATYRFPPPSTATAVGLLTPLTTTLCVSVPAAIFTTCPLLLSATYRFPAPSMADPFSRPPGIVPAVVCVPCSSATAPDCPTPLTCPVNNGRLLPCTNSTTAPARAPGAAGWNTTVTVQLCPTLYAVPTWQLLLPPSL